MSAQPSIRTVFGAVAVATCMTGLTAVTPVEARVTRIVIDTTTSPAFAGQSFGTAGQYETIAGRAFGELDPNDPHNTIITDIALAPRNAGGKVEYMATFFLVKPIDMSRSSHLLWQDVPNRGGRLTIGVAERNAGDVGLSSGWQGDNSGATAQNPPPANTNDYAVVPVAKNPDGSTITGPVIGRIFNVSGVNSQPMIVYTNPVPYVPASLDTTQATLITHASETNEGVVGGESTVPSGDWAFASCSAANPFPGTPDPTRICLRNGFNPALAYYVKFMAKDPYVLGIGFAAFRDLGSFFKNQTQDDVGTANPVAGGIRWEISRGSSQSGNFLRAYLDLGFNQDEAGRQVHDASWPTIAGGRLALNVRFGLPDNAARFYDAARDGPTWWTHWPDPIRNLPAKGILDRCTATATCPKIVETFGSTELWYLRMNQSMVGAAADTDIPLTRNIRRYYISGTTHGGGGGGFSETPPAVPNGSGTNWGQCTLNGNPLPHTETRNALLDGLRKWVMNGTPMVPSRYPTLIGNNMVEPTKLAIGFPTIPGLPPSAPDGLVTPVIDYDFGPRFSKTDESGIIDMMPPALGVVLKTAVPRVDADGNEVGGVPAVLHDAPLGTYTGWNITAAGFYKDRICSFTGGMIPFARTTAQRLASGDPRPSLEERYGSHAGYVAAVQAAANNAFNQGFLLDADRTALIAAAQASNVCAHGSSGQSCDPAAP